MLGFLEGKIISKNSDSLRCVILVGNLGYELTLSKKVLDSLTLNETSALWVETIAKENSLTLYGFNTEREKKFFKLLIGVTGLGPKTALSLINEHGVESLVHLIVKKDPKEISTAPGVGKKSAERIILELSTPVEKWMHLEQIVSKTTDPSAMPVLASHGLREDLYSALLNLGYLPHQVKNILEKLFQDDRMEKLEFEKCLRWALKEISNRVLPTPKNIVNQET